MTMRSHPELDQLSAYVDDELAATERTALEAHLPSCAECRATLDALRATIADLSLLPDEVPTEQDSWALRSAIAKARRPVGRWQRVAWSAGAVAAVAIAVVAIVRPGGPPGSDDLALRQNTARELSGAGSSSIIRYDAGAFTQASAHAKLLVLSGKATPGQVTNVPVSRAPETTGERADAQTDDSASGFKSGNTPSAQDTAAAIGRCVTQIQGSTQEYLSPVEYDVATYESKPAFLLFFQTSGRYELWVVERPSCTLLYFAQAA
jgi:hypothetical protein